MLRSVWTRYRDRRELRKAEHRFRLHLDMKSLFPDHTYAQLDEDLETIKKSLMEKRSR